MEVGEGKGYSPNVGCGVHLILQSLVLQRKKFVAFLVAPVISLSSGPHFLGYPACVQVRFQNDS